MMAGGRLNKCVECAKADVRQNRVAKIAHYRSYDRMRASQPHRVASRVEYAQTPEGRLSTARAHKKWEVSNALRRRVHNTVSNAIRDGRLQPQPCFVCGARAQAHHADYDAPLAVTWLCPTHHAQAHKEHREWMREAA